MEVYFPICNIFWQESQSRETETMTTGVTISCFLLSYLVAFALELSRLYLKMPWRMVGICLMAWLGLLTHGLYLWDRSLLNHEQSGHWGCLPRFLNGGCWQRGFCQPSTVSCSSAVLRMPLVPFCSLWFWPWLLPRSVCGREILLIEPKPSVFGVTYTEAL